MVNPEMFNNAAQDYRNQFDVGFWSQVTDYINDDFGTIDNKNRNIEFPDALPSKDNLWNKYKELSKKKGIRADYRTFAQSYALAKQADDSKLERILSQAADMGFKGRHLRKNVLDSPEILARVNKLIARTDDPNTAALLQEAITPLRGFEQRVSEDIYEPFSEFAAQRPITTAIGGTALGAGIYYGGKRLLNTEKGAKIKNAPKAIIDKAKSTFKGKAPATPSTTALSTTRNPNWVFFQGQQSKGVMGLVNKAKKLVGNVFKKHKGTAAILTASSLLSDGE
jgi:hypothetical protein